MSVRSLQSSALENNLAGTAADVAAVLQNGMPVDIDVNIAFGLKVGLFSWQYLVFNF